MEELGIFLLLVFLILIIWYFTHRGQNMSESMLGMGMGRMGMGGCNCEGGCQCPYCQMMAMRGNMPSYM